MHYRSPARYSLGLPVSLPLLIIAICFVSASLLPTAGFGQEKALRPSRESAKPGGTYRRPLGSDPLTLDPHRPNDVYGRTIANQIFDGLVEFNDSLAITPAIASSWRPSRDGMEWTFHLKKGVRFHNGREVTAEDFVYSFTRILDPKTKSKGAALFAKIRGAREFMQGTARSVAGLQALDRYTLKITLAESDAPLVATLAVGFAKVVPREVVESLGDKFGAQPVGTGGFKFVQWERNKRLVLEANPDYFGGRPYLDRVEYRVIAGESLGEMLKGLESGEFEDSGIPASERTRLLRDKRYQFIRRSMLGLAFLGFNTLTPPLDDPRVRQAVNYAIDKPRIVKDIYADRYLPGTGILPPGTYGYDPKLNPYPYDPKKARELLAAAGYPEGKGLPALHLWSGRKNEEVIAEHEAIAKYLAAIGVKLEIHYNTNGPEYISQVYAGNLPIFRYSWYADTPDPDTFLFPLFHSKGPDNTTRYKNPDVDDLIRRARGQSEYMQKVRLYQETEHKVIADAPLIVLSYYSYERVFQPYVHGIYVSALGDPYIPMKKIWLDPRPKAASQRGAQ